MSEIEATLAAKAVETEDQVRGESYSVKILRARLFEIRECYERAAGARHGFKRNEETEATLTKLSGMMMMIEEDITILKAYDEASY